MKKKRLRFVDIFLWFDILAVFPFWLYIAVDYGFDINVYLAGRHAETDSSRLVEALQSFRTLRIFKLLRRVHGFIILRKAFRKSYSALILPFWFFTIMVSLCGSIIYFIELERT